MRVELQTCDPSCGYELCIFPTESRRTRAAWILWVSADGSGVLYTNRDEDGGILDDGLQLPKNISRKKKIKKYPKIS